MRSGFLRLTVLLLTLLLISCSNDEEVLKEFDFESIQSSNNLLVNAKKVSPLVLELIYKGSSSSRKKYREDWYNEFESNLTHCELTPKKAIDSLPSIITFTDVMLNDLLNKGVQIGEQSYELGTLPYNLDEYDNRTDLYKLHSWHHIKTLIDGYLLYGENELFFKAINSVLDWYEIVIEQGEGGSFSWYDMSVGERAVLLPVILQEAKTFDYPAKIQAKLTFLIKLHQLDLMESKKIALHSNHGIFQMLGLLYIEKNYPCLPDSLDRETTAQYNLLNIFQRSFSNLGVHLEHSPGYHLAMSDVANLFVDDPYLNQNLDTDLEKILLSIGKSNAFMSYPNGNTINRGDSIYKKYAQMEARSCTDSFFVDKEAGKLVFETKEYCTQLSFDAAYHNNQHKHLDGMTFDLYEFDKPVIIETGFYPYLYTSPWRKFVTSTRAHNTVEINNSDYILSGKAKEIYGSSLKFSSEELGLLTIYSEQLRVKSNVLHKRVIKYFPTEYLLVVDVLTSDESNDFNQWFHLHPDFNLDYNDATSNYYSIYDSFENNFYLTSLSLTDGNIGSELRYVKGQDELGIPLQGFVNLSNDGKSMTPRISIKNIASGMEVVMVTLLSFEKLEHIKSIQYIDSDSLKIETTQNKFEILINGALY